MADDRFAQLVSLACHDLRTPLATVSGFAKTIVRMDDVDERLRRYLGMIDAASEQLAELLDDLALVARIETGRWEPVEAEADTLALARAAAERLDGASAGGEGGAVAVEAAVAERALYSLARCALRHGGVEAVSLRADGERVRIEPLVEAAAPICLGEDLRDLGSAVAVRTVAALGGSTDVDGEALVVRLPGA